MKTLLDRLEDKILVGDGCWEWTAGTNGQGYGTVADDQRRMQYAHRAVYELMIGPIPDGMDLDHLCRNPGCVRPGPPHTEPVTHKVNIDRGLNGALKTHCAQGHPWVSENIYVKPQGRRMCRVCSLSRSKARRARLKAFA